MADVILSRPQVGQNVVVDSTAGGRLVLQFPTDQAVMERAGDNLVFNFEDGSKIELNNFYNQYNQENMPEFQVDGILVAGADFFEAFGPDLMPAAGPAGSSVARNGRYNDYENSDLADGIDHLNELDWDMSVSRQWEDVENTYGTRDDDYGVDNVSGSTVVEQTSVTPVDPSPVSPVDPTPVTPVDPTPQVNTNLIVGTSGTLEAHQDVATYNISLMLDNSSSMWETMDNGMTRFDASKSVLLDLADNLANQVADNLIINVQISSVNESAVTSPWITLTQDNVADFKDAINALQLPPQSIYNDVMTNYDEGFKALLESFKSNIPNQEGTIHNKVYFVADGNQTTYSVDGVGDNMNINDLRLSQYAQENGYDGLVMKSEWAGEGLPEAREYFANGAHSAELEAFKAQFTDADMPDELWMDSAYFSLVAQGLEAFFNANMELLHPEFIELSGMNIEINMAGFTGPDLNMGELNLYDTNNNALEISNSDDIASVFDGGKMTWDVVEGNDVLNGTVENDIMFGDRVVDGITAESYDKLVEDADYAQKIANDTSDIDKDDMLLGGDGADILFGQGGDDYLNGGNDDASDYLYGGAGNDILVYNVNDVIDGGEGVDVLLVGNDNDLDAIFNGSLDADINNVEVIVSGDVNNLTNADAFKEIGVVMGENSVEFGAGWTQIDAPADGYDAFTNGSVTVAVSSEVEVQQVQAETGSC